MKYDRIRKLREERNLTQEEMGNVLNVSKRTYSNYETGKQKLPIRAIIALADYYGTSTDYIISLTDEKTPHTRSKKQ